MPAISYIEKSGEVVVVHLAATSLSATKSFTHGRVSFDHAAQTVTFGSLEPVEFPSEIELADGQPISFQLAGPDGEWRKQTRSGVLKESNGVFRIAGRPKTPSRFASSDGWGIEVYKYRAYYTHPGLTTTGEIPAWLQASIDRQRSFWNSMAWLCRDARRKCSPDATEEVRKFVAESILPAIDALNNTLGRSNQKMKYPKRLMVDEPNIDGLYNLLGVLRDRVEKGKPVPDGMLDEVLAFATRFNPDYAPINSFMNNVLKIGKQEAEKLGLKWYESGPMLMRFTSVLKARKTLKRGWSEGWPLLKYPDSPGAKDWSFTHRVNKAGVDAVALDAGKSVFGLEFGKAKPTSETGHPLMTGDAARNKLREATITLSGGKHEPMEFRFAVLEHRPIPAGSHIKQWQLAEVGGRLWLNLTLEIKRDVPAPAIADQAAGLDVGWRRTEEGIRIGVLHEPIGGTFKEILLDFQRSPKDHAARTPFRLDLGPTRWEKRNITSIIPDWKPGDVLPGTVALRNILASRRSALKDNAKALLRRHLGEAVPAWFDKAGKRGLLKLAEDLKDDAEVQRIVNAFSTATDSLNALTARYFEQSTRRIEYSYQEIAHDILKYVVGRGLGRVLIEEGFLAQVSKQAPELGGDGYYALANSQKYRQFAAVGKFVAVLKMISRKYGVSVEEVPAAMTTRLCHECGHLNPPTPKQRFQCGGCQRLIDQDYNAAANLAALAVPSEAVPTAA